MSSEAAHDPVIVAIDAGTTGVRAFAVDADGRPIGRSYREFTQHFPQPGWVEHDAAEIWDVTRTVLAELHAELGRPIAAVGVTDQRETVVAWDRRTGAPLARAIVWQDRRTAERCDELTAAGELEHVRRRTGLVLDPYFSATKMEWLLRHGGVAADEHLAFGTIDSWLVWNLTGGASHVTDPSNASRTMLYDICEHQWSDELCELFGVPRASLPEVRPSAGEFGRTAPGCGLPAGIPITGIAGDQQASLFGQACVHPGMAKNTYGTGSFVLMNIGSRCPDPAEGLLTTVGWTVPASMLGLPGGDELVTHYALEGSIFVTGAAVQWLRDGLELIDDAAEVGPLAASVDNSAGLVLVPAFTGLGSPYWDPYARGTVMGITRGVGRAHLARAVVESMAYQTRDVVEAMTAVSGEPLAELRVDGGAAAMEILLQIQADQLGVPVARSAVAETTALGAATLAGLGVGLFETVDEVNRRWRADARVEPSPESSGVDDHYAQWRRAVERSRDWAGA
jgi:glycerol kinase